MTQKIYTIAEIIHFAADNNLILYDSEGSPKVLSHAHFSCSAISSAVDHLYASMPKSKKFKQSIKSRIRKGLRALGLNPYSLHAFEEFLFLEERQQVRYAWLKFVALLAEEQGV